MLPRRVVKEAEEAAVKAADDTIPGKVTDEHSGKGEAKVEGSGSSDGTDDSGSKTDNGKSGSESLTTQIIIDANIRSDSSRKEFDELTEHIVKQLIVDPKSKYQNPRCILSQRTQKGLTRSTIRTVKENASNISSIEREPEFY